MSQFEKATPFFASMLAQMHGMCFDKGWDEQAFSSLLSLPTTQGLLNHEGFVLCSVCRDEAEILTLGVLPEARRKKVGTHLLEDLFSLLKKQGIKTLFLDVDAQNKPAVLLYEKVGFEQVGMRKGYYTHGLQKHDALIFQKKL